MSSIAMNTQISEDGECPDVCLKNGKKVHDEREQSVSLRPDSAELFMLSRGSDFALSAM